jgi:hypothetical protein
LQAAAPDPGLGSVAFGLGSDERNTITDFTDASKDSENHYAVARDVRTGVFSGFGLERKSDKSFQSDQSVQR